MGGWKANQSKKKIKKNTKLAAVVLGLVLVLLFLGYLFKFLNEFNKPLLESQKQEKKYSWEGISNINLVVKKDSSDDISVLSFNPTDQKLLLLKVPPKLFLYVPGGYGSWQLSSIYKLGEVEKKGLGKILLKNSISNFLGVPIDGFIQTDKEIVNLLKNPSNLLTFTSFKTDLNLKELISLTYFMYKLRFDKLTTIDLSSEQVLDEATLADGSLVYLFDPGKMDSISANFNEGKIIAEGKEIAIFNATNTPGLAQKAARMVTNMGGKVIMTKSLEQRKVTSQVLSKESSATFNRLATVFALGCSSSPNCDTIIDDPKILESRADINIVLGEDFK